MEPGNTPPVDIYSFLYYIPQRFLGNWIGRAQGVNTEINELYAEYLNRVSQRRREVGSTGSFINIVLDQNEKLDLNRHRQRLGPSPQQSPLSEPRL